MSLLRTIRHGLRSLFRRAELDRELDDEVRHYIEQATLDNIRTGMPPAEAERVARVAFGGVESAKEGVRRGGWEAGIETLWQDVRYGIRGLRRNPGFTIIAVVTLALGIGANTAMFSVVNAVMLRPLPYRDGNKLAMIWTNDVRRSLAHEMTAFSTVTDWQREARTLSGVGYFFTQRAAIITNEGGVGRERSRAAYASASLFDVLGVPPIQGRLLARSDEETKAPVAVISHALWQRKYAGADVIGKQITADVGAKSGPATVTIVGVMPASFYFPDKQTELWLPATTYWRFDHERDERFQPWARHWMTVARLAPGASFADARNELTRIGARLSAIHTTGVPDFPGFAPTVDPLLDNFAGPSLQTTLWTLLGAVGLVLLVACANIANLLLARGASRQREFAVRRALGAGRGRLVRQLIVESVVLAMIGGAIGTLIAAWGTRVLAAVAASQLPRIDEIAVDARVLIFAFVASVLAGVVFGLLPALRVVGSNAADVLKEGARGTGSARLHRHRGMLVVAESALAIVLLVGAGLLLKSLMRIQSIDPGFDPRGVLAVRVELAPSTESPTATLEFATARARAREETVHALLERVRQLPGVEAVGISDDLFVAGRGNNSITIPGRSADSIGTGELNDGNLSPGYFPTMRVSLKRGRYLTRDDGFQKLRAQWTPVRGSFDEGQRTAIREPVVVNETFVRRFFPNEDPIGKTFCIDPTNKPYWYEIVGVVGDMHRQGLERQTIAEYYGSYVPAPNDRFDLVVRVAHDPMSIAPLIRREVPSIVPGSIVVSISTTEAQLGNFTAQRRFQTWLLVAFAALALSLAAIGIYGVVHYAVAERTREIGVRVALGASPTDVIGLVIRQGMRMPAIGIATGLAASIGVTRVLSHLLFGIGATDPTTFVTVGLVLGFVAMLACYFPARRATRVDPISALRTE